MIIQVHFWAAIFPYTTKYNDTKAHLKLILLPLTCSKIVSILRTYRITFLKQLIKSRKVQNFVENGTTRQSNSKMCCQQNTLI